jgi:hypothetical protein
MPVSGPDRTVVDGAANGSSEPRLPDAVFYVNDRSRKSVKTRFKILAASKNQAADRTAAVASRFVGVRSMKTVWPV